MATADEPHADIPPIIRVRNTTAGDIRMASSLDLHAPRPCLSRRGQTKWIRPLNVTLGSPCSRRSRKRSGDPQPFSRVRRLRPADSGHTRRSVRLRGGYLRVRGAIQPDGRLENGAHPYVTQDGCWRSSGLCGTDTYGGGTPDLTDRKDPLPHAVEGLKPGEIAVRLGVRSEICERACHVLVACHHITSGSHAKGVTDDRLFRQGTSNGNIPCRNARAHHCRGRRRSAEIAMPPAGEDRFHERRPPQPKPRRDCRAQHHESRWFECAEG